MTRGLKGSTILVADDEPYITTTISLKLRQHVATLTLANDVQQALEISHAHRPDLICSGETEHKTRIAA